MTTSTRDLSWLTGGSLLILSVVLGPALQASAPPFGGNAVGPALSAAALLVFAIGRNRSSSVVARRPVGTAALIALAALTVWNVAFASMVDVTSWSNGLAPGYVEALLWFVLAVVAAVQIARAGIVPAPWHRAPLVVVGITAAAWVLQQLVVVAAGSDISRFVPALATLDGLVAVLGPTFLGIVAIMLGSRASAPSPLPSDPVTAENGTGSSQRPRE